MMNMTRFSVTAALLFSASTLAAQATAPVALTLGGAARLAAEMSAGPQAAKFRSAQAEARVRQTRAEFLPNISAAALDRENTLNSASFPFSFADPSTGRSLFDPNGQVVGPVKNWDLRGTLRQNIYDPGSFARLNAAKASATASNADVGAAAQQAAAVAASAYLRAQRADAQLSARQADSTLAAELLGIARDQLSAGVGVALDVTRAQSQLSQMHSQLIMARNEQARTRVELVRALNLPQGTIVTLSDSLPSAAGAATGAVPALRTPAEDDAVGRALQTRADLKVLADQSAAAERQLDALRSERLPSLGLFADQGGNGKGINHLLSTYTWGIQLSVPVFDGFRREGRVDEQRATMKELDVRRSDLQQQTIAEIRTAVLDVRAATELLDASAERVGFADQELTQARDRFRAGVSGNADVITASMTLNSARTQLIDARAALQSARVALARAQGTITELP